MTSKPEYIPIVSCDYVHEGKRFFHWQLCARNGQGLVAVATVDICPYIVKVVLSKTLNHSERAVERLARAYMSRSTPATYRL